MAKGLKGASTGRAGKGCCYLARQGGFCGWGNRECCWIFLGGFACLVALLVTKAENGGFDPSQPLKQLFAGGVGLSPFDYSLDAFRLLVVTLAFGGVSTALVCRGALGETYPGYTAASKPYVQRDTAIRKTFKVLEKKLNNPQSLELPSIMQPESELARDVRLLSVAVAEIQTAMQAYEGLESYLQRVYEQACTTLIGHYEMLAGKQKVAINIPAFTGKLEFLGLEAKISSGILEHARQQWFEYRDFQQSLLCKRQKAQLEDNATFIQRVSESLTKIRQDENPKADGAALLSTEPADDPPPKQRSKVTDISSHWGGKQ
jgi:hypothetical protein